MGYFSERSITRATMAQMADRPERNVGRWERIVWAALWLAGWLAGGGSLALAQPSSNAASSNAASSNAAASNAAARGAAAQGPTTTSRDAPRRPNVVFVLADDLGWTDTGTYGSRYYETPHIDRLAAEGLKFTSYHNCQNCQPTRAALLTGQYAARTGVYTVGSIDRFPWQTRPLRPVDNVESLPLSKVTIAQALREAGYATGLFGKWHLGQQGPYHPSRRGFDEALVTMGRHFDFVTQPAVEIPPGVYLADWLTDRAEDFIRRHREQPFFLYLPHFGVHSPHQAKPELVKRFRDKPAVGGHHDPTYAAMIASVDESVGRLLKLLDELQLTQQTVFIFSSDNGGVGGYVREGLRAAGDVTDNAPLRSGKGSLYEGGVRDPFIVRWPGTVRAGATCDVPTIHVDLFPTLLEIAGAAPPAGQILDGESLVPLFRDPQSRLRREAIFQHFPGYLGAGAGAWRTTPVSTIQVGDWKLLEFLEDGRLELYDLRHDIGESRNRAADEPARTEQLRAQLQAWRAAIGAPLPTRHTPAAAADSTPGNPNRGNQNKGGRNKAGKNKSGKNKAGQNKAGSNKAGNAQAE